MLRKLLSDCKHDEITPLFEVIILDNKTHLLLSEIKNKKGDLITKELLEDIKLHYGTKFKL